MYPEKWNVAREHPQIERTRWVWWKAFSTHPVVDWRILYFGLLLTCIAFITRSSFRVAEFQGGYSGVSGRCIFTTRRVISSSICSCLAQYLYVTEGYFWALDAVRSCGHASAASGRRADAWHCSQQLPLFLGLLVFVFIWPPRFLKFPELFTSGVHGEEEMLPTGAATVPAVAKEGRQNTSEADVVKV